MRSDLDRKIVEDGARGGHGVVKPRRRKCRMDVEDLPQRQAMGRRRQFGWGSKEFGDKLSILKRWMYKQCGRPWNDVYHDICSMYDRRSTMQRHVHQHIEMWMRPVEWAYFEVDENGILCAKNSDRRYRFRSKPHETPFREIDNIIYEVASDFVWYEIKIVEILWNAPWFTGRLHSYKRTKRHRQLSAKEIANLKTKEFKYVKV